MEKSHSGLGIASFILALFTWFGLVGLGIMAVVATGGSEFADDSPVAIGLGLGIVLVGLIGILAVLLGIAGVLQSERKKTFGFLGLVISLLAIASTIALTALGNWDETTPTEDAPAQPAP